MSKQSYFKQFSLALVHRLVLFDPQVGPGHILPLWVRADPRVMTIKG